MKKLSALFLASTLSALPLMASAGGTLDLSLSDTTARIAWDATQVSSGMHLNAAYMHGSEENAEGDLISAGLHVVDVRKSQSRLYMGIGGNVYVFSSGISPLQTGSAMAVPVAAAITIAVAVAIAKRVMVRLLLSDFNAFDEGAEVTVD